jgi:hypothetical protein
VFRFFLCIIFISAEDYFPIPSELFKLEASKYKAEMDLATSSKGKRVYKVVLTGGKTSFHFGGFPCTFPAQVRTRARRVSLLVSHMTTRPQ